MRINGMMCVKSIVDHGCSASGICVKLFVRLNSRLQFFTLPWVRDPGHVSCFGSARLWVPLKPYLSSLLYYKIIPLGTLESVCCL